MELPANDAEHDPATHPQGRDEWLAFAQETLGLADDDAEEYATRRALEDENRGRIAARDLR
jgi:hypothetical protein